MKSLNMIGIPLKKISFLFFASFFLQGLTIPAYSQPGRWSEPVNISNMDWVSTQPDMAIGFDNKIHVVWEDATRLGNIHMKDILYVCYDGFQWSEPVQLSAYDTTYSQDPKIVVDSYGYPHVVWEHNCYLIYSDIYYTTLTDTGWIEPVNLTGPNIISNRPDIAVDNNDYIHIVWADYVNGSTDIFHSYFNGEVWSDQENITNSLMSMSHPRIQIDSQNNLHVVWQQLQNTGIDNEIFYTKFNGFEWEPMTNISNNDSLHSTWPNFAIDTNDNPHIVWSQEVNDELNLEDIYYIYHDGITWSEPENIFGLGMNSLYPSIEINNRNVICLLFNLRYDDGIIVRDPMINYSFFINGEWTYPDSVTNVYPGTYSAIAFDNSDVFHACITIPISFYDDICYTYFQPVNECENNQISVPTDFNVECYPNPFNCTIKISYTLSEVSEINLKIYNIKGELVNLLQEGIYPPGSKNIYWNGTTWGREEVSGGVYFIRLHVNDDVFTDKIILIR